MAMHSFLTLMLCMSHLVTKICRHRIAGQTLEESLTLLSTGHCSVHNVDPPSILPTVPWPTSEHGVNIRCLHEHGGVCTDGFVLWASAWLVQTVAHLTALSQTSYKRWKVRGSLVPPPAELCLQWNQRVLLTMRLLIQTFAICLALSLCLTAPSWVLLAFFFLFFLLFNSICVSLLFDCKFIFLFRKYLYL